MARPLVKWAGGKALYIPRIVPLVVSQLATDGHYYEPFLGGGAVALHLALGPRMVLSDKIGELVEMYRVARDEPGLLAWCLSAVAVNGVDEQAYYAVRDWRPETPVQRAARLIYLNRLCYNGVYRVNKSGGFNVPYAKDVYRKSVVNRSQRGGLFPSLEKILEVSAALRGSDLSSGDFERTIVHAGRGDVIYADPPYDGTYDAYTAQGFTQDDQVRLAGVLRAARGRGAFVVASNADTPLVRSLYDWAEVQTIDEKRSINADTNGRQRAACVLVVGRP